jgi:hypothetical protein
VTGRRLLVVEGNSDKEFFAALLRKARVANVETLSSDGTQRCR